MAFQTYILSKFTTPKFRVRRPVVLWGVHSLTLLAVPESQAGPETDGSFGGVNKNYAMLMRTKPAPLKCSELLSLQNKAFKPSPAVLSQFKSLGILKYRRQHSARISRSTSTKKIPVMQGRRFVKAEGRKVDRSKIINIPLVNTTDKTPPLYQRVSLSQNVCLRTFVACRKQKVVYEHLWRLWLT